MSDPSPFRPEGPRSAGVGGDADHAVIVTGDNNLVLRFEGDEAASVRALRDRPLPDRPFQLPSDVADFVGRRKDVENLLAVFRSGQGRVAISALGGMGGIGKTALAVHVAHQLAADFPAGQIVVDLRGTSPEPLTPADAMRRVITALELEARVSDDLDQTAAQYRSLLHDKRLLLLLDNAADAAQAKPLFPDPPAAAIVTSRRTLALPGVTSLSLDALSEKDACALVGRIAGPRRTTAGERRKIAELCGRLPLALRVAASFLKVHPDWTVPEYLEALASERKRLELLKQDDLDVEAALGLSAAQLVREQPDLAARWQVLSVFPADFDRAAAAAVWEASEEEARDALSSLLERNLLEYARQSGRYSLHDLMRLVARRAFSYGPGHADPQADQDRLAQGAARHAVYYQQVLAAAEGLYLKGGDSILPGLRLFEREWHNVQTGQSWAAGHADQDDSAARLVSDYANAGANVLLFRLPPRERIVWHEAALAAARRLRDRGAEGRHLGNLGIAYRELGEPRQAIEFHEQALAMDRELGDRRGEGQDLGNLGNAYIDLGEPRRAIEFLEQRLAIAREVGDRRGEGYGLGNLGNAYRALGEPRRAIEFLEQTLAIAREIGGRRVEGNALCNLGVAHRHLEEPRRAMEFYEQALAIAREIGDRAGEGIAMWNMALSLRMVGEPARAIELAEGALGIFEQIESPHAAKVRAALDEWRGEKA